jgi:hypothetical protein
VVGISAPIIAEFFIASASHYSFTLNTFVHSHNSNVETEKIISKKTKPNMTYFV